MLLKAEKIISHGDILIDRSEEEILKIACSELAQKIVEQLTSKDLMKVEIVSSIDDSFGEIVRVRASVRAYHPDD